MADKTLIEKWRVFLASPGDVAEERRFARQFLRDTLPSEPFLHGSMAFEVVCWDDPDHGTPMPAHLTPQEAVTRFHGRPADCDVVVVILWSRMGTRLDASRERKPDGTPFLSGTEWEYLDAFNASPRPEILVYRREDEPQIGLRDPDLEEKRAQQRLVDTFFEQFTNPDGSARGGFQTYRGVDGFGAKFAADLKHLVAEHPRRRDTATTGAPPAGEPAPIHPPARCYGRGAERDGLVAALTGTEPARLLVLGAAGIGKTTLTRLVAADPAVSDRFGARRYFASLETASDAATMRAAIIQAIGLSPASVSFADALAELAQAPSLLLLDNLETPWEPDQSDVQDVLLALASTPHLSLLASLRGAAGPSVPRWTARPTRLGQLGDDDARLLFLDIAPEANADPSHLARFIAALGGVPLAIELVASRAAGDTPLAELWAEWQRLGVALVAHPDQAPGRLTSLVRSLDLSWGSPRLREPGRRLFRLLGALPAGVADTDRSALLGQDAFEAARQLRTVGLAFQHGDRLDLLPPVRDYARSEHSPTDDDTAAWCRHFLALTRDVGGRIFDRDGADALIRLAPEVANVAAALAAAPAAARVPAVEALDGVLRLFSATGLGAPWPLVSLAAACAEAGDPAGEARCHFYHGRIAFDRSDHDAARERYEAALPLYRRVGDVNGEANCIKSLGNIALDRSDHDAARERYEAALPLYRRVGDVLGEANCIKSLGDITLDRSDHDAARERYEAALPLYRRVGDVLGEANCIQSLGDIALARSDHAAARERYEAALPLFRRIGDVLGEANCIRSLGDIALARSDHDAARERYEAALPLYRRVGAVLGEANCIQSLGDIALDRSDHAAAREHYEAALPLFRRDGGVVGEGNCALGLGRVARAEGEQDTARQRFNEALALYERVHHMDNVALAHEDLAGVTSGAERDAHVRAAKETWLAMGLPDRAARVERRFG